MPLNPTSAPATGTAVPTSADPSANRVASFLQSRVDGQRDPALKVTGAPPNWGQFPIPHVLTFSGLFGTYSRVYRMADEATKHSLDNARFVRNDCGIMECVESRQRSTALLDWTLEPEDEQSQDQKELCRELTKILNRISRFTEYRFNLLHAIWFGRYGIQHRYRWEPISGQMRVFPVGHGDNPGWKPIHGDKLVFRYDDGRLDPEKPADQLGIRVGSSFRAGAKINDKYTVESTDRGLAYFVPPYERSAMAIHKHTIEDSAFEDGLDAGTVHGVGIRSRIYWDWFQKQESLAFLMEYLERSAGGIELWYFPLGNPEAEAKAREAAEKRVANQRNVILVPKPIGDDGHAFGVEVIEPGLAGIDALKDLLINYFGHRIKRYILGQTLSSEADATGLGSGLAELHLDTLLQIIRYDAVNLSETITTDLVKPIKDFNFPSARNIPVRFNIQTESPDVEKKLEGWAKAYEMGARLKERDVMELIGAAIPDDEDRVLQHPQFTQQTGMPGAGGPGGAGNGWQPPPNIAPPDPERDADAIMRQLFGQPQEGGTVAYVAEGGKWVKRDLPAFDTGERARAARDGSRDRYQFDEQAHPRDNEGKFTEGSRRSPTTAIGKTNDGRSVYESEGVHFVRRRGSADRRLAVVMVDATKLDEAWAKDGGYYIPKDGGGGEIEGRRSGVERFLSSGGGKREQPIEMPIISLNRKGEVQFTDGRHRTRVLINSGMKKIPVLMTPREAVRAKKVLSLDA